MIRFILVVVLLAAIPLPAVGQITLHRSPVPTEVDVYRLAAPEIVPAVAPSGEEPAQSKGKGPVWTGALVGGTAGCVLGATTSRRYNDDAHLFNCLWVAGHRRRARCPHCRTST